MKTETETALLSTFEGVMKAPTFDSETVWSNYGREFEAAAGNNSWTNQEQTGKFLIKYQMTNKKTDTVVSTLDIRYGSQYLKQVRLSALSMK